MVTALMGTFSASLGMTGPAMSAFSGESRNAGNAWTATSLLRQPYTTAVLADSPYLYYMVDEAAGPSATDASGNARTGTYTAISAYRQPGGLPNNFGYSVAFNANLGRLVSGGGTWSNPRVFTLELWFKTTTVLGGKLIGFEVTQGATSPANFDRHVYMLTNGRLVYGGWGSANRLITSPLAYNNGAWHYLALTTVNSGPGQTSVMYVDGVSVVSGATTNTTNYAGWWRVGYGSLPTGGAYPPANFVGNIDNVAVYPTTLSAARIAAHYAAR